MLSMVNELLDVATIEAGELKIAPEVVVIAQIVEKAAYWPISKRPKSRPRLSTLAGSPCPDQRGPQQDPPGDRQSFEQCRQIFAAGSNIAVETAATGRSFPCGSRSGPGIPESERDRLFKDFGRMSTKPTGGEKSTGSPRHLPEDRGRPPWNHHGRKPPGGGCVFRFTLPI